MRRFTTLFLMYLPLVALTFAACTKTSEVKETPSLKAEVSVELNNLTVEAEGGQHSLAYTITNGKEGVDITPVNNADWISDLTTADGKITFVVAKNSVKKRRSTKIVVNYPDVEPISISITQSAFENISFEITVGDKNSTSCTTSIKPSSNEIIYVASMSELDYLKSYNITTAEELFLDDYYYVMNYVDMYEVGNVAEFMYMNNFAFMGETNVTWTGIIPGKEYVVYAYAIEFNEAMDDFVLASEVSYVQIYIEAGMLQDIEFDIDITVNGPDISYEFAPVNWDGKYYFDVFTEGDAMYLAEGSTPDDDYSRTNADNWLMLINQYMSMGYGPEQLMELMCLEGADSHRETRNADTKYMISFYAIDLIDGIPQVVSKPYIAHFKTEPVEFNDMNIDIKVENLYVRVADVIVTPSADHPYTMGIIETSIVPQVSDDEIIRWLLDSFYMSRYEGVVQSHVNTFEPDTEYTLLAFGYHGNIVTSKLFRYDFKTEPEGECENSVLRVDVVGPYSPRELATADPDNFWHVDIYEDYGFYMMYSEIFTEYPSQDVYHFHYEPSEFASMGDAGVFEDLTTYNYTPFQVLTGRSGIEFIMCGVTMDYRGNYSEMWKSEPFSFNYTPETKRPIEELLDKIEATRNASLVYNEERTPRSEDKAAIKLLTK